MTTYRIIYLDAFTHTPFAGNPCAVLPAADGLTEAQMQKIARETNLSETAFVLPSQKAAVKVRYFMPNKEIPFAGHPTIATAFMLAQEKMIPPGEAVSKVDFEFNIGVLPVEIHWDADGKPVKAVMSQKAPVFGPQAEPTAVADCLGLDVDDLMASAPIQVVSTGVPFLLVPVRSMEKLCTARMDRQRLALLLKKLGVDAAYLFCTGGVDAGTDLHGRFFSPAGSGEDPFTGSAVGGAGAYAVHYGLCPGPVLTVEQGYVLQRPGKGTVELAGPAGSIQTVKVGGSAVRTLDGSLYV